MTGYSNFKKKVKNGVPEFAKNLILQAGRGLVSAPKPVEDEIEIVLLLKRRSEFKTADQTTDGVDMTKQIGYDTFKKLYGASQEHIDAILKFAAHFNFKVVSTSLEQRTVVLRGPQNKIAAAFNTHIANSSDENGKLLVATQEIQFPEEIFDYVQDVFGLNTKKMSRPPSNQNMLLKGGLAAKMGKPGAPTASRGVPQTSQMAQPVAPVTGSIAHAAKAVQSGAPVASSTTPQAASAPAEKSQADASQGVIEPMENGYTGAQMADLYSFPQADGAGQTIGVIELGGGYVDSDIDDYFKEINLPRPEIVSYNVGSGKNSPGSSFDGEVMLDILVLGAVVPKAKQIVYFCPDSSAGGFIQGLQAAVHDSVNMPSVISVSWGLAEKYWSESNINSFEEILKDAATLGITICISSGDEGSSDGEPDGGLNVQYPSSSAYALSCGGTSISVNAGAITEETVWETWIGTTGGGFSSVIDLPDYQKDHIPHVLPQPATKRGLPDVAANADTFSGYYVIVNGEKSQKGGTSAVAPLWAGLVARMNQLLNKKIGYIHPIIYQINNAPAFNQILSGSNGAYSAAAIWNPCTGLGTPKGDVLFSKIKEMV